MNICYDASSVEALKKSHVSKAQDVVRCPTSPRRVRR